MVEREISFGRFRLDLTRREVRRRIPFAARPPSTRLGSDRRRQGLVESGKVRNRRYPAVSASMNEGPDPFPQQTLRGSLRTASDELDRATRRSIALERVVAHCEQQLARPEDG